MPAQAKAVASSRRDMKAELQAWKAARDDRIAQERARKAAKPDWKLSGKAPVSAAGTLLWAARALPTKGASSTPRPRNDSRSCAADGDGKGASRSELQASVVDVNFLEMCLGGPDALLEQEIEEEEFGQDPFSNGQQCALTESNVAQFTIHSRSNSLDGGSHSVSSLSDDFSAPGLDDMFAFDPEKLAAVLNKNASKVELTEFLRASYADALEERLLVAEAEETNDCKGSCRSESSSPRPHAESLSQLMTPLQITPITSPRQFASPDMAGGCSRSCTVQAFAEALDRKQRHSRRSSVMRRRASAVQREEEGMRAVERYGRRSLESARDLSSEDQDFLKGAIETAVKTVSRRHRRSLDRAVEVLECAADAASESLEQWAEQEVGEKVDLIHQAMDEACRLHRRSIVEAVRQASMAAEETLDVDVKGNSTLSSYCNPADVAAGGGEVDARIRRLVSEAYARQTCNLQNSLADAPQARSFLISAD